MVSSHFLSKTAGRKPDNFHVCLFVFSNKIIFLDRLLFIPDSINDIQFFKKLLKSAREKKLCKETFPRNALLLY